MASSLPVIDLSGTTVGSCGNPPHRQLVSEVVEACERFGSFLVVGHGVDLDLIEDARVTAEELFDLPDVAKRRYASVSGNPFRGWAPTDVESATGPVRIHQQFQVSRFDTPESVAAAGYAQEWVDRAEPNLWPDVIPSFEGAWKACFDAMEALGERLLGVVAAGLGLEAGWFSAMFRRRASYLACNRYELPPGAGGRPLRLESHTDIGSLTILHQDDGPGGLQIRDRAGEWVDVDAVPGTLVVNLGDLFERWTNGRWAAPEHRVAMPPPGTDRRRMSVAYFQAPDLDAVISCLPTCTTTDDPPRWPPVVAGEWSRQQMQAYSGA